MYGEGTAALSALAFPRQIWESVPYLASYVSPALRAGRSIPLLPRELEVAWNGKSRCATLEHVRGHAKAGLRPFPLARGAGGLAGLCEAAKGLSVGLPGVFPLPSRCPSPGELPLRWSPLR